MFLDIHITEIKSVVFIAPKRMHNYRMLNSNTPKSRFLYYHFHLYLYLYILYLQLKNLLHVFSLVPQNLPFGSIYL